MTEPAQGTRIASLYRRVWYVPDTFAAVFLLFYMTFLNTAPADYIGGLHNTAAWAFAVGLGYACMGMPIALVCLLFVAIRMGISWPRHILERRRLCRWRLLVGCSIVACIVFFFSPLRPGGFVAYQFGFRKYVQASADIPAIRRWLRSVDPDVCTGERIDLRDPTQWRSLRLPGAIASLNPDFLRLRQDSSGRPAVRLSWTGLDVGWGVTIGSEQMEISSTAARRRVGLGLSMVYEDGEYRLPVEPGVYVWQVIH
jgi:amino acid transporter